MSPQLCAYFYILCHRYCRKHILIAHHHINDNEGYTQFFTLNENIVLLCRKVTKTVTVLIQYIAFP